MGEREFSHAGRRKPLLVAVMTLLPLYGCTSPGVSDPSEPASTRQISESPATEPSPLKPAEFVGRRSPLIQQLWQPVADMTPLRTLLPQSLDFSEIRRAPLLDQAPIKSAVLAVGTVPRAYSVGEVAVMSPSGEWRIVDRNALGMRNPAISEQQFKLSPNGRLLALGDEFGVVIVELATATVAARIKVPSKDPVLHWWSPDGASVVMTRRSDAKQGLAVRVLDRTVEPLGYHVWASSPGPGGRVAELAPNSKSPVQDFLLADGAFTAIQFWRDDRQTPDSVTLENAVPNDSAVGRRWSSSIGVVQGAYPQGQRMARGVLAIDPTTGKSQGLLHLTPAQTIWTSVVGALDDRWLLLNIPFGPGGGLCAWDPVGAQVRGVLPINENANLSIAMELVSASLR